MSERKEKSDKGRSSGLLLEICQINKKSVFLTSLSRYLLVCLFRNNFNLDVWSSRQKTKIKRRQDSPTSALFNLEAAHTHISEEIYILLFFWEGGGGINYLR